MQLKLGTVEPIYQVLPVTLTGPIDRARVDRRFVARVTRDANGTFPMLNYTFAFLCGLYDVCVTSLRETAWISVDVFIVFFSAFDRFMFYSVLSALEQ